MKLEQKIYFVVKKVTSFFKAFATKFIHLNKKKKNQALFHNNQALF